MKRYLPRFEQLEDRLLLSVSAEAQHFIYLLNRARHDPQAYEQEAALPVGLLAGVESRPPLAVNEQLNASALFHAREMAEHDYFGHQSLVTGDWPNKMARDAGYPLPSSFASNANNIESIAAGTFFHPASVPLAALIVDEGIDPPGHRRHLLGIGSFHAAHREIGVGYASDADATYTNYWAIHATRRDPTDMFLTGVAFNDTNSNARYDPGEGLGGVSITAGTWSTTTNAAGGWALEVVDGVYTVQAAGQGFQGVAQSQVIVNGESIEVDFLSGQPRAMINFQPDTNVPPTAHNDVAATAADTLVAVNVLINDVDPEGQLDASSVVVTGQPAHGTAVVDALTNTILYTPGSGFSGIDQLRYQVGDMRGGISNNALVTVIVSPSVATAWQNAAIYLDVSGDGLVTPIDALLLINELNQGGSRSLPAPSPTFEPPPFLDVSGDGLVTPVDALLVINFLNLEAEAEAATSELLHWPLEDLLLELTLALAQDEEEENAKDANGASGADAGLCTVGFFS